MGVRGLKTFLESKGKTRPVNIKDEIHRWKSENFEQTPTIVFNFCGISKLMKKKKDFISGGVGVSNTDPWDGIFKNLIAAGCRLVFFSDQRLNRKDEDAIAGMRERFEVYTDLYDRIEAGQTLQDIDDEWMVNFDKSTTYRELATIARKYEEFRISMNEECDLELAQYASDIDNNVKAVVSNDTDFLTYEGTWQLWWTSVHINLWKDLKTTEYIRRGLENVCSLRRNQSPLFATLPGTDLTTKYRSNFHGFKRIADVADYVNKVGSGPLSDSDIKRIQERIYKDAWQSSDEIRRSIRDSLKCFDIAAPPTTIGDKLAETLLNMQVDDVDMFRTYMRNMGCSFVILASYYDVRGCGNGTNLITLMIDWARRRSGILRQRLDDETFELTIWAKTGVNEDLQHIMKPIIPDCMYRI